MFPFSESQFKELQTVADDRRFQLFKDKVFEQSDAVVESILSVIKDSENSLINRLMGIARTFNDPRDLKISLYVYDTKKTVGSYSGIRITMGDVVDGSDVLYKLSEVFGEFKYGKCKCFRISTGSSRFLPAGWREILLHYYPYGVPFKFENVDPRMPGLEKVEHTLPASPPAEEQEQNYNCDTGHVIDCACRECDERWYRDGAV
jgi:hypothetical protein